MQRADGPEQLKRLVLATVAAGSECAVSSPALPSPLGCCHGLRHCCSWVHTHASRQRGAVVDQI